MINEILFWKVWRNLVINKIILKHLYLVNKYYSMKIPDLNSLVEINEKDYIKNLEINFNYIQLPNDILLKFKNLNSLKFGNKFNQSISNLKLLTNNNSNDDDNNKLKSLEFGHLFNKPINGFDLIFPKSIIYCKFGNAFNSEFSGFKHLTRLTFGSKFNQPLIIPNSITHLEFGKSSCSNLSFIDIENSRLEYLNLGNQHKPSIPLAPNSLPKSIRVLHLSKSYNCQLVENAIPHGVLELYLGNGFNKELIPYKSIPPTVTILDTGKSFIQKLSIGSIPDSVTSLKLPIRNTNDIPIGVLSNTIKSLTLSDYYTFIKTQPQPYSISIRFSIPLSADIIFLKKNSRYLTYLDKQGNKIKNKYYIGYY